MKIVYGLVLAAMLIAGESSQAQEIILFEDTFNDSMTTVDDGVPNTSVSGLLANTAGSNYNLLGSLTSSMNGAGFGTFTEDGGVATLINDNFADAAVFTLADFATNADVIASGQLIVELDDVTAPTNPEDQFSLAILGQDNLPGNITIADNTPTILGLRFFSDGGFTENVGQMELTEIDEGAFDASSPFDVRLEITDLQVVGINPDPDTGLGGFSYEVFVNGTSIETGALAAGILDNVHVAFASRDTAGGSIGNFRVSTVVAVPEPTSLALFGVVGLGLAVRRRR